MRRRLCEVAHLATEGRAKNKGTRIGSPCIGQSARSQFTRVQVWPPQNMPPKAQPCTRSRSVPFIAIVES